MKNKLKFLLILPALLFLFCSEGDNLPMPNNPIAGKEGNISISVTPDPYPAGSINLLVKWTLVETGGVDVSIDSIISNVYSSDGTFDPSKSEKFDEQIDISQLFSTYMIYENDSVSTVFNLDYVPIQGGRNEIIVYGRDRYRNIIFNSAVVNFE